MTTEEKIADLKKACVCLFIEDMTRTNFNSVSHNWCIESGSIDLFVMLAINFPQRLNEMSAPQLNSPE